MSAIPKIAAPLAAVAEMELLKNLGAADQAPGPNRFAACHRVLVSHREQEDVSSRPHRANPHMRRESSNGTAKVALNSLRFQSNQ